MEEMDILKELDDFESSVLDEVDSMHDGIDSESSKGYSHEDHIGFLSGSSAHIFMPNPKKDPKDDKSIWSFTKTAISFIEEKAYERMHGISFNKQAKSRSLDHGKEYEPDAIREYEIRTGEQIYPCEFVTDVDLMIGSTPDGKNDEKNYCFENKCPMTLSSLRASRKKPKDQRTHQYFWQMQYEMKMSNSDYCVFNVYDYRLDIGYSYRIDRYEDHIGSISKRAEAINKIIKVMNHHESKTGDVMEFADAVDAAKKSMGVGIKQRETKKQSEKLSLSDLLLEI